MQEHLLRFHMLWTRLSCFDTREPNPTPRWTSPTHTLKLVMAKDVFERKKANDEIDRRLEEFEEGEKTLERMLEMMEFIIGNE